ncbi:MAG: hypothetical protein ACYS80_20900 [Planctomycetota bacterium]|jgi:hypothetical protein
MSEIEYLPLDEDGDIKKTNELRDKILQELMKAVAIPKELIRPRNCTAIETRLYDRRFIK